MRTGPGDEMFQKMGNTNGIRDCKLNQAQGSVMRSSLQELMFAKSMHNEGNPVTVP